MEYNIEELENICKKILTINPSFRLVGVINDKGKLIASDMRKDLKLLMDSKEAEMVHTEIALMMRMRREHDAHLGPVNFAVSHREKVVLLSFPLRDDILYISSSEDIDLGKIPFTILQILRSEFR